ncbi:excinuclease ABC subunit UvrC [Acetobacter sp. AN02]|uniref:excinuclease ABC subunit UvrC n=1 Tax=Acetobacter sp. AN02 TaxID=2894186 RepID=UPI00243448F5|nr:excinuclease ABC subunit UvrC [Acetobacter sp. AN02]MDG6094387.1 excinuclease ABC subunit UvrC [Acetobacter sp. AN02]
MTEPPDVPAPDTDPAPPSVRGADAIRNALKTMPLSPGVYRMLGEKGEVLYVGKAKVLKNRVTAYTRVAALPERLRRMVALTVSMEIVTTHTEAEALLLEANYIKRMKPRFNILLRDDKSFPWLVMTCGHDFPQIAKHRGKLDADTESWGPFASAWAVNQTLTLLQRVFLLRTCTDSVLASRTRPCMLYQIRRCSAPCDDRISQEDYARLVRQARDFLSGRDSSLNTTMAQEMEQAAATLDYERAAVIRDRIRALAALRESSVINPSSIRDGDVVSVWQEAGQACIQVFFVRGARNNGNRAYFPAHTQEETPGDILAAFLGQFYDDKPPPALILVNHDVPESGLLAEALSLKAGRKVTILQPQRGERREVSAHAELNAREALQRKLAESAGQARLLAGVAEVFSLPEPPSRIEVYDNSHIMGAHPYGVMIVGGPEGFDRRAYRKYGIKGAIAPGDDFAMMKEVLRRRFGRALKEAEAGETPDWPDLLLIDGGAGQYSAVRGILDELGVTDVTLAAIAKGPDRDAGREWFFTAGKPPFQLEPRDPVLYYLQRLRDEAHRFAITTHRAGRSKALVTSELDEIPGIGPGRKKALLHRFGSARGVKEAGLTDLEATKGISREIARTVYGHFHPDWSG